MQHPQILTIGTSTHQWSDFQRLLELAGAEAIIDVRSRPYGRWRQFNQPELRSRANFLGLPYLFFGDQLGGLQVDDRRTYQEVSSTQEFKVGIARAVEVAGRCRPVLICADRKSVV